MNETEKKMLVYLQALLNEVKRERYAADNEDDEIAKECARIYLSMFHHCKGMFESVTGKKVTFREWKVIVED